MRVLLILFSLAIGCSSERGVAVRSQFLLASGDSTFYHGPYVSFGYHADGSVVEGDDWHQSRNGVLDLRTGRQVSVADLFGDSVAGTVVAEGTSLFSQAVDSVIASSDSRARGQAGDRRLRLRCVGLHPTTSSPALTATERA